MAASDSDGLIKRPNISALQKCASQYLILNPIGAGNQGSVYFAVPRSDLPPRRQRTPALMLALLRVVKIDHIAGAGLGPENREIACLMSAACKAVQDKWVPKLHCVDSDGQWLATSYAGVSLKAFADLYLDSRKVFPLGLAWQLLKQLLKMFAFLHSGVDTGVRFDGKKAPRDHRAVTHSDLIAENLCVVPTGVDSAELRLIDFGWGREHPRRIDERYKPDQARADTQRIADIIHLLLHRGTYHDVPNSRGSYCWCHEPAPDKKPCSLPRYDGIIEFMDNFASNTDVCQLTCAEALAHMDEPGFWDDKPSCSLPQAWKDVLAERSPKGENVLRCVEFVEDLEAGRVVRMKSKGANLRPTDERFKRIFMAEGALEGSGLGYVAISELNVVTPPAPKWPATRRRVPRDAWDHLKDTVMSKPHAEQPKAPPPPQPPSAASNFNDPDVPPLLQPVTYTQPARSFPAGLPLQPLLVGSGGVVGGAGGSSAAQPARQTKRKAAIMSSHAETVAVRSTPPPGGASDVESDAKRPKLHPGDTRGGRCVVMAGVEQAAKKRPRERAGTGMGMGMGLVSRTAVALGRLGFF